MKKSSLNFNLPKQCTQSLEFIENTKYDGKGILIAILDSGVDPGAECVQTTTDGTLKVIDYLDATGSGIVDTSLVLKKDDENKILSPFSRKSFDVGKIDCPSGEFNIGFKSLFDVYPAKLRKRVKVERKKRFEKMCNQAIHDETDEIEKKVYETLKSAYEDIGPFVDCFVWKEGSGKFRCCCTNFDDTRLDLSEIESLTNYRDEPKYLTFTTDCQMNYTVNIYDEGRRLSIVNPLSGHGTHVASIAAGHYPNTPEFNGVAPGAQIVSIKISDARLDSDGMETGTSVVKGLYLAKKYGANLINFSFGEPAHNCKEGIVRKILQKMWEEDNIIMCCSAGNSGPAFGAAGAPGSTYPENFGIGAFVNRKMMKVQYFLPPKCKSDEEMGEEEDEEEEEDDGKKYHDLDNETLQVFSSCGPTTSGWYGPDFIAPGSSVAGIPNFMLCRNSLKNGTSMSSPHALKGEGMDWTPHYIRMMVQASSKFIKGCHPYRQGSGLIQVLDCLDVCKKNPLKSYSGTKVHYTLRVPDHQNNVGIYIRNYPGGELSLSVVVYPVFHKSVTQDEKMEFEKHFRLVLRNREARRWIQIPGYFSLANEGRSFQVTFDGKYFEECGVEGLYSTEILAFYDNGDQVPAFRVPVCVIVPTVTPDTIFRYRHSFGDHSKELKLHSGVGHHEDYISSRRCTRFFEVPYGASYAVVRIRTTEPLDASKQVSFKYVSMLILDNTRFSLTKGDSYFRLWKDNNVTEFNVSGLTPLSTLEITVLQHWKFLHTNPTVEMQVEWKGVQMTGLRSIHLYSGVNGPYHPILLHAPLIKTKHRLTISGSLTHVRTQVQPSKKEVICAPKWDLDSMRDPFTLQPMKYLFLEYFFKNPTSCSPVLSLGKVQDHLYEGEFVSVISLVFSMKTKALLGVLDFKAERAKAFKIPDGWVKIVTRISHHDDSILKNFAPDLYINTPFSPAVKLEFWRNRHDAMILKGTKMDKFFLFSKRTQKVFCSFNQSKLPISKLKVKGGDEFQGVLCLDAVSKSAVTYTVPPKTRKPPPSAPPKLRKAPPAVPPKELRGPTPSLKKKVKSPSPSKKAATKKKEKSESALHKSVLDATLEYLRMRSRSLVKPFKPDGSFDFSDDEKKLIGELQVICDRLKEQCKDDEMVKWDIFRVEVRLCESLEEKIKKLDEGISQVNVSDLLLSIFNTMGVVPTKQKREQEELEWCLSKKLKCLLDIFLLPKKPEEDEEKEKKKKEEEDEEVEGEEEEEEKKPQPPKEEDEKKEEEGEEGEEEKPEKEEEEEPPKQPEITVEKKKKEEKDVKKELLDTLSEWKKWTHQRVTKKNLENVILEAKVEWKVHQKRATAMGLIKKYIHKKEELYDMYLEMIGDLKWKFWEEYFRRLKLIKFPDDYKYIF